jgi:hypothetical protein
LIEALAQKFKIKKLFVYFSKENFCLEMERKISGDEFWSGFQNRIDGFKERLEAIPANVLVSKKAQAFFKRNLSIDQRSELDKMVANMESNIAKLEKKATNRKRGRTATFDPALQELVEAITNSTLKNYLILQLFNPEEDVDDLVKLCRAFVDLPESTSKDCYTIFGKKLDKSPMSEELVQLQNKLEE